MLLRFNLIRCCVSSLSWHAVRKKRQAKKRLCATESAILDQGRCCCCLRFWAGQVADRKKIAKGLLRCAGQGRRAPGKIRVQKIPLIALALTCAPTVCLGGGIDDALINTLNAGIDRGIASVQAELPLPFGRGLMVAGVRREGRTIIYTMDFQPPPGGGWSTKAVDNLRELLTKRVCADNGKSWFDLGYVTQLSVWDRDRFIANIVVDSPACGY
jgi:hypothetical protein